MLGKIFELINDILWIYILNIIFSVITALFAAFVLAIVASSNAFQQQACLGASFNQLVLSPSPRSCNQYVACFQGRADLEHCNPGRHYNAQTQQCGTAGSIDCTRCGTNGNVNLPHPTVCQRYFECIFGWRTERICPNGFLFDRQVGSCNRGHLVNCNPTEPNPPGQPNPPNVPLPVCIPGGQVHHGHPTDCTRFFQCINGVLHHRVCPNGHHWSERRMACDTIANAGCFR